MAIIENPFISAANPTGALGINRKTGQAYPGYEYLTGGTSSSSSSSSTVPGYNPMPLPTAPSITQYGVAANAQNYPTYMRNLGEAMAQEAFQKQVNQGIGMGSAAQAYQRALTDRNMSRLAGMSAAGKADMDVQNQLAAIQDAYMKNLLSLYGISTQGAVGMNQAQASAMNAAANQSRASAGSMIKLGGGSGSSGGGGGGGYIPLRQGVTGWGSGPAYQGQSGYSW